MKSADIKLHKTYAVKIGGRIVMGVPVAVEKRPNGRFAVSTSAVDRTATRLYQKSWCSARAFVAPWAEYLVERDHTEAVREDFNRDRSLEYDRRERAKRERFAAILPAFEQLPCDRERHYGQVDLATLITDIMVDGGSSTVTLSEFDLTSIAECITELRSVVAQNALTADDLPQAGWGLPPIGVDDLTNTEA